MGQGPHKGPSPTRDAWSHSTWRQGDKSRRRMASERQVNRLPGLLAIKMIREQTSFANRLAHQSTTSTNKRWQWRTLAEHIRLKSGPPLMRRLGIHKNILVSGTKLAHGLGQAYKYVHIIKPNVLQLNKDFFFLFLFLVCQACSQ